MTIKEIETQMISHPNSDNLTIIGINDCFENGELGGKPELKEELIQKTKFAKELKKNNPFNYSRNLLNTEFEKYKKEQNNKIYEKKIKDSPENNKNNNKITRRGFLAAAGAFIGGYIIGDAIENTFGKKNEGIENFNKIRDAWSYDFLKFKKSISIENRLVKGEIVIPKEIADSFVKKEIKEYCEVRGGISSLELTQKWNDAMQAASIMWKSIDKMTPEYISENFLVGLNFPNELIPFVKINLLVNSFLEDENGDFNYQENMGNVMDVIQSRKFQCNSGSDLFTIFAFYFLDHKLLKNFFIINKIEDNGTGHQLVGVILSEHLFTFEITQNGINITEFQSYKIKTNPIAILKSIEGFADCIDGVYNPYLNSIKYIYRLAPELPFSQKPFNFDAGRMPNHGMFIPDANVSFSISKKDSDRIIEINEKYKEKARIISEKLRRQQGLNEGLFHRPVQRDNKQTTRQDRSNEDPTFDWKLFYEDLKQKEEQGYEIIKSTTTNTFTSSSGKTYSLGTKGFSSSGIDREIIISELEKIEKMMPQLESKYGKSGARMIKKRITEYKSNINNPSASIKMIAEDCDENFFSGVVLSMIEKYRTSKKRTDLQNAIIQNFIEDLKSVKKHSISSNNDERDLGITIIKEINEFLSSGDRNLNYSHLKYQTDANNYFVTINRYINALKASGVPSSKIHKIFIKHTS